MNPRRVTTRFDPEGGRVAHLIWVQDARVVIHHGPAMCNYPEPHKGWAGMGGSWELDRLKKLPPCGACIARASLLRDDLNHFIPEKVTV